jgi:topoisomerase-4 subunit A
VAVFKKKDKRTIYNMIYRDGSRGNTYVKRFAVTSVTRDREYDLTAGKNGSRVFYFTANPNGEAEVVTVTLRKTGSVKKLKWDLDFADILVKGRGAKGNIVTKYPVKRIELKEKGLSTLKPRKIWFDDTVQRLNVDGRGELLGEFTSKDRLLIISQDGTVKTVVPEMTLRFDEHMIVLEKWEREKPLTAIYWEGERELFYVKRFLVENPDKEEVVITDHPKSYLEAIFTDYRPMAEIVFKKERGKERKDNLELNLEEFITVKGITAMGNQLTKEKVLEINALDPLPFDPPKKKAAEELDVVDEEDLSAGNDQAPKDSKPKPGGRDEQPTLFD